MDFKDYINEINNGLKRTFQQQNPHLPSYVANQVSYNRIAPLWNNVLAGQAPTIGTNDQPTFNKNPVFKKPSEIFRYSSVSRISQNLRWEQKVITIGPLDFTPQTIQSFLKHEFGSSPSLAHHVKNHEERMKSQNQLAIQRGVGNNEPIVLIQQGDKYHLEEGWHRLYAYFLQYSAPPNDKVKIQNGDIQQINLAGWKPVEIKAWIGST